MHLKFGSVTLSSAPDFDAVEIQPVKEVATEILLSGQSITRVANKGYTRILLGNSPDNGINKAERAVLNAYQIGDVVTVEENYSTPGITVWAGCVIVAKRPMKRLVKTSDSGDNSDFFSWGFELLHNTEA